MWLVSQACVCRPPPLVNSITQAHIHTPRKRPRWILLLLISSPLMAALLPDKSAISSNSPAVQQPKSVVDGKQPPHTTVSTPPHLQDVEQHHFITGWAGGLKLALCGILHNGIHRLRSTLCIQAFRHTYPNKQEAAGPASAVSALISHTLIAVQSLPHRIPSRNGCGC